MADIIQIRRDAAADWTSEDPTLANGEIGYETDTGKCKVGDGVTAWTALAYWLGPVIAAGLDDLSDVTIDAPLGDEVLAYDGVSDFINMTAAEASLAVAGHTHVEADITDLPGHEHTTGDLTDFDPDDYLPLSAGVNEKLTGNLYIAAAGSTYLKIHADGDVNNHFTIVNTNDDSTEISHVNTAGNSVLHIDAEAGDNLGDAIVRFCRYANTVGTYAVEVSKGNGSATAQHRLNSLIDGDAELVIGGGDLKVGGTTFMPDSALAVTGLWNFVASGVGGFTDYDLEVGDVATADYGMIRIGDSVFGRTSRVNANLDLDGTVVIINRDTPPTSNILFAMMDGSNSLRFALPKAAAGNATYNPRSMLHAGPAPNDDTCVTVGYWQTEGIFHNLACDTDTDGADLGVQNDCEIEGDLFVDNIEESTGAAGVTIDGFLIKDGAIPAGSDSTAIHDNVASEITAITAITAPAPADEFLLEDASDSNNKKAITYEDLLKFNAFGQNITITVSNDSGSEMSKGDLCYISGDSSGVPQVTLADADAESTGSKMLVLIAETIANTADGTAVAYGVMDGFTVTAAAIQFVSTTAGDLTETAPSANPDIVRICGHAISTTEVFFNPSSTFIEIAA